MAAQTWLISISPAECADLLATSPLGRLGVILDGRPEIFPVNHVYDRETGTVTFPTNAGSKLHGALHWPYVAYEVDGVEPDGSGGWSVALVGSAEEITDPDVIAQLAAERTVLWRSGESTSWIRIVPEKVTGRRITAPAGAVERSFFGSTRDSSVFARQGGYIAWTISPHGPIAQEAATKATADDATLRRRRPPVDPARLRVRGASAVAIVFAALLSAAGGVVVAGKGTGGDAAAQAEAGTAGTADHEPSTRPDRALLASPPTTRFALGEVSLDSDIDAVVVALGAPAETFPDLFGPTSVWQLPGGELAVSVWEGTTTISGLTATVQRADRLRVALFEDVFLGEASLRDVIDAWGTPARFASHETDDLVAAYEDCAGGSPIIAKVDQLGVARGADVELSFDAPVDRVLIAYADEPPGAGACAAA